MWLESFENEDKLVNSKQKQRIVEHHLQEDLTVECCQQLPVSFMQSDRLDFVFDRNEADVLILELDMDQVPVRQDEVGVCEKEGVYCHLAF